MKGLQNVVNSLAHVQALINSSNFLGNSASNVATALQLIEECKNIIHLYEKEAQEKDQEPQQKS